MATYSDLANYRNSSAFTDRCTLAIASYAKYILGQTNVPAKKYVWAANSYLNPYGVFQSLAN